MFEQMQALNVVKQDEDDPMITEVTEDELMAEKANSLEEIERRIKVAKIELQELQDRRDSLDSAPSTSSTATMTTPRLRANVTIAGTATQTDVEVKVEEQAGREPRTVVTAEKQEPSQSAAGGSQVTLTINHGGQPITLNIWLNSLVEKKEEKFCEQVGQTIDADIATADEETDLLKLKEEIKSTKDDVEWLFCAHCCRKNFKGVVYCRGCYKIVETDSEKKQEAKDNEL